MTNFFFAETLEIADKFVSFMEMFILKIYFLNQIYRVNTISEVGNFV